MRNALPSIALIAWCEAFQRCCSTPMPHIMALQTAVGRPTTCGSSQCLLHVFSALRASLPVTPSGFANVPTYTMASWCGKALFPRLVSEVDRYRKWLSSDI